MIRKQRVFTQIVLALLMLLLSAAPVVGKGEGKDSSHEKKVRRTHFTGTRYGPEVRLEDGEVWTTADGVTHLRNRLLQSNIELDLGDSVVTGVMFLRFDADWIGADTSAGECSVLGPQWGTFSIVLDGNTEPSWGGIFYGDGDKYGYRYHKWVVGYGAEEFAGLTMKAFSEVINPGCPQRPNAADWSIDGVIYKSR